MTKRYEYGKVICIFMGCVYAYVIILTFIGPEKRGKDLSVNADEDAQEVNQQLPHHHGEVNSGSDDEGKAVKGEKEIA